MTEHLETFREDFETPLDFRRARMVDYNFVSNFFKSSCPEAIVISARCPRPPRLPRVRARHDWA